jgi:hypothetical protein
MERAIRVDGRVCGPNSSDGGDADVLDPSRVDSGVDAQWVAGAGTKRAAPVLVLELGTGHLTGQ